MHNRRFALLLPVFLVLLKATAGAAGPKHNLLANGGFEKDSDGDGVADGWIAQPFNFSKEKLQDIHSYIRNLPPFEELLRRETIRAADGTILWERQADQSWGPEVLMGKGNFRRESDPGFSYWGNDERSWKHEENWHGRMRHEYLPQNSRFGELPLPEGLDLGRVTLVLSAQQPHKQVMSKPIAVRPDTGYLLSFWARTSGAAQKVRLAQVLNAKDKPESVLPDQDLYGKGEVLNAMPADFFDGGVPYWIRFELPFRTPPKCDRIIIRLPYPHPDKAAKGVHSFRIWYDDFCLVELDPRVAMQDISGLGSGIPREAGCSELYGPRPQPDWPSKSVERGFAVVPRPTLPPTLENYLPTAQELNAPVRITLAPGETDSAVIFVRNLLGKPMVLRASGASSFTSERGEDQVLGGAYGSRFVTIRAAETHIHANSLPARLDAKRYVYAPEYLFNSTELTVDRKGGQFWLTVTIPPGTPGGKYTSEIKITRVKPDVGVLSMREATIPVVLTVRDLKLEEPDIAFGTYYHTSPWPGMTTNLGAKLGSASALPGADEIYLADQRRHGMNTVANYCYGERVDRDGKSHINFHELDAMVTNVQRAGLCRGHPLVFMNWSRPMEIRGEQRFGFFAGGEGSVMAISEHAQKTGWPAFLFAVSDEPCADGLAAHVVEKMRQQYQGPRKKGVRTTVASGRFGALARPLDAQGHTLGEHYDVWIETGHGNWSELRDRAARQGAEVWMYGIRSSVSYLEDRFFSGLYTWRTGVRGNMAWSYGWYVRINDSGLPESRLGWEGRLAGVNDYRYLQTLEKTIAAGERAGKAGAAVRSAKEFLETLRQTVPYSLRGVCYSPEDEYSGMDRANPVPKIRPQDYDRIRDRCAQFIIAIRRECGL